MNVNTSILRSRAEPRALIARAAGLAAFALSLSGSLSIAAAQAHPRAHAARADQVPAPAPAVDDPEQAPIDKFDLAAALMAPTGGLTSDEAGKRARARAPQIMSARATASSSQLDVDGSWSSFIPIIDFLAQYKHVSKVDNAFALPGVDSGGLPNFTLPLDQFSFSASIQYVVSDVFLRAWPAYQAAVSLADSQKTQIEVAESVVDLTARNAFYDYARALAQRAVDEQSLKQAEAQAAQIKLFVDAGTSAQVDYMTATARVEEARSLLAVSQGRVAITQNTLATLTGMNAKEIAGIAEPVLESPPPPKGSEEELVRQAFDRRAELRALRKMVKSTEHLRDAQFGGTLPQLVLGASDLLGKPNPRYIPPNKDFRNTWEVTAGLAWRPNNSINGSYAVKKVDAQTAKARADLGAQEDSVRIEVFSAYQTYKSAETVNTASQARLAAAEEAYRVRLATYRVGAGVIVDLLNADLAVSQARLALANSAIATRAALAALNRAAGLDTWR